MSLLVFLFNYVNWNTPSPQGCRKKLWREFELVLSCSAARQYGMEIWKFSVEGKQGDFFNCRRRSGVCARSNETQRAKI
jgi:hypothetical protein